MKDAHGNVVQLGDRVRLWADRLGYVVCSFDDGRFGNGYPASEWGSLKGGILVELDSGDVFHYAESDEDLEVISLEIHRS